MAPTIRPNDLIVFDSIAQSNIPTPQKTAALRVLDEVTGGAVAQRVGERGRQALQGLVAPQHGAVREGLESVLAGSLLGAIESARGTLDVTTPVGVKIPLDLAVGVLGLIASAYVKSPRLQGDARTVANVGLGVYGYRQGAALTKLLGFSATPKSSIAGEDDPIKAKAERL
jgi:hypothetical protein